MHALLLVALLGSASPAEGGVSPMVQAQQLYRDVEFERATIKFQEAALDTTLSSDERAIVFVWIGMCHAQVGDQAAARDALANAVELNRDVAPPSAAPPSIRALLEEVRAQAPLAPPPEEPEEPPADAAPAQRTHEPSDGGGVLVTVGWVAAGAGGLSLIGAAVLLGLGLGNVAVVADTKTTQREVLSARDLANAEFLSAAVLAGLGAALVGAGVGLIVVDGLE